MFQNRAEYDRGVNTFSPEGRLFQVEYAISSVKLGSTAVGIRTQEGVVLAAEKRVASPLIEAHTVEKILEIDSHIGVTMSGIQSDARMLVERARVDAQNHRFTYDEAMKVKSVAQGICDIALNFGEGERREVSRPFGVSLLFGGVDETGPQLYHTDPSGTCTSYKAMAIGAGYEGAMNMLQEGYSDSMTLEEAETLALSILKQVMEKKVEARNVEVASVTAGSGYKLYDSAELQTVVDRL